MLSNDTKDILKKLLTTSALGAFIAAAPVTVGIDTDHGVIAIKPSVALADDDDGGDSDDGPDDDRDDDDDDDDDDDEDDDEDDDDDDVDDGDQEDGEFTLDDGTTIEVSGNQIEVEHGDGWEEEIGEDGRYEMKDPAGNTVVERQATAADRERLVSLIP